MQNDAPRAIVASGAKRYEMLCEARFGLCELVRLVTEVILSILRKRKMEDK